MPEVPFVRSLARSRSRAVSTSGDRLTAEAAAVPWRIALSYSFLPLFFHSLRFSSRFPFFRPTPPLSAMFSLLPECSSSFLESSRLIVSVLAIFLSSDPSRDERILSSHIYTHVHTRVHACVLAIDTIERTLRTRIYKIIQTRTTYTYEPVLPYRCAREKKQRRTHIARTEFTMITVNE